MARAGACKIAERFEFVVAVDDLQGDRAADRLAVPNAGEDVDAVGFDPLATTAAIAPLPPAEFRVDDCCVEGDAGGKTVDQGDEGLAVRFTGGPIS